MKIYINVNEGTYKAHSMAKGNLKTEKTKTRVKLPRQESL